MYISCIDRQGRFFTTEPPGKPLEYLDDRKSLLVTENSTQKSHWKLHAENFFFKQILKNMATKGLKS